MFQLPAKGDYLKAVGTAGAAAWAGIWAHGKHKNTAMTIVVVLLAGAAGYAAGAMLDQATGY